VAAFGVFGVRLFQLQILEGADLRNRSLRNSVRTVRLEAPRGEVVDREGRVLATTRPAFRVQMMPNELLSAETVEPAMVYAALGQLLERPPAELASLVGRPSGRRRFQPVVLDPDLGREALASVEAHRYALPGVLTDIRPRRDYVGHELAAHLLGSIGEIEPSQLEEERFAGYRPGEIVGRVGLEAQLETHLRGRAGGRNVVVDVSGREVEVLDEVEPVPGGRAVLTLDLDLQRVAEEAFRSEDPEQPDHMGALVALDPRNGDVLALVSRPGYDPNVFAGGVDTATWAQLTRDPWEPLLNRAISGAYPPGSTYKAFVAAAGLTDGHVDSDTVVFCPGYYRLGTRVYRCWKRAGHGPVSLREALRDSCDVYFYELGIKLGIERLAHFARAFGLGSTTGIRMQGEKAGLVPTPEWKQRVKKEPWIQGETVSVSIGQGANLVTPLQLAVAYAAIANGGELLQPRLVLRRETWDGRVLEETPVVKRGRVDVSPEVLREVVEGLTAVVMDRKGTGGRARVPGVSVAGKTGTTQVVSLRVLRDYENDEDIPVRYRDHALFAAFAPVEAPEIAVAVVLAHAGGGGGRMAAPIAQRVLARYFEKRQQAAGRAVAGAESEDAGGEPAARRAPGGASLASH